MRAKSIGSSLLVACLLAACAGEIPGLGTPGPSDTCDPDEFDCGGGGGGGGGEATEEPGQGGGPGTWHGFVTYKFHEDVDLSEPGLTNKNVQTYEAKIEVSADESGELTGDAEIYAMRSLYWEQTAICYELHDDQAVARAGSVDEQGNLTPRLPIEAGGLEVGEVGDLYQFWISLPNLTGHEVSKRVYGPTCGQNLTDPHDWIAGAGGPIGGDGTVTDPDHLSGQLTSDDGREVTSWDLTRTQ